MSAIKYLLDENGDRRLVGALRRQAPRLEVGRIGEPGKPALGSQDPEILAWCEVNGYSLISNDRSTIPLHFRNHILAGHHVLGVFLLRHGMSLGDIVQELLLIWGASEAEEYRDRITYIRRSA